MITHDKHGGQRQVSTGILPGFLKRRMIIVFALLMSAAILSWPAVINRSPFFMADTTAYLRSSDAFVSTLTSKHTIWSDRIGIYSDGTKEPAGKKGQNNAEIRLDRITKSVTPGSRAGPPLEASTAGIHPPLLGRSIYFGSLMYLPAVLFGELSIVLLSALVAAYTIWLCLDPLRLRSLQHRAQILVGTCAILSIATPLPYVVSTLMPDYLSGILVIALILLGFFWERYSVSERTFLAGVIVFGCLSHSSNVLLTASILAIAVIMRCFRFPLAKKMFPIALLAIFTGVIGDIAFAKAVELYSGIKPVRPPFLTARLISDGPGYSFVRQECDGSTLTICQFRSKLPSDSDVILWSPDPANGVFSATDWQTQERLGNEDTQFAIAVFKHYPIEVLTRSARAFFKQLTSFQFDYFNTTFSGDRINNLPPEVATRVSKSRSYNGVMLVKPATMLTTISSLLSLLTIVFIAWVSRKELNNRWVGVVLIATLSVVANAAISGILSKPDPRYTLKILWILPLFAAGAFHMLRARLEEMPDEVGITP